MTAQGELLTTSQKSEEEIARLVVGLWRVFGNDDAARAFNDFLDEC